MPDQESISSQTLAQLGKEIVSLFHVVRLQEAKLAEHKSSVEAWKNEIQRFNLWADNLGLHHRGHSSLDYRLREATIIESLVKGLLNDLRRSLQDRKLFSWTDDRLILSLNSHLARQFCGGFRREAV